MSKLKKVFFILFILCFSTLFSANVFCMTLDEFINDSRFKPGVSWGNDKRSRNELYNKWKGTGCFAYCQEYVYECWGKEYYKPQQGISYSPENYKTEVRAGDVIHKKWDGGEHWFIVLERDENKLKVAEGNYTYNNDSPKVRVEWKSNDLYLGSNDQVVGCYHAPKLVVSNNTTKEKESKKKEVIVENKEDEEDEEEDDDKDDEVNIVVEKDDKKTEKDEKKVNTNSSGGGSSSGGSSIGNSVGGGSSSVYNGNNNEENWSEWTDNIINSSDEIEVQTREVPKSYKMISYCCTDYDSPSLRSYYTYKNGILRLYHEYEWSAEEFNGAIKHPQGTYYNYANNVAGYIRGNGDAYTVNHGVSYDCVPCYIAEVYYKTQYRSKKKTNSNINTDINTGENESENKTNNDTKGSAYKIMNGISTVDDSAYGIVNGNSTIGNSGYGIMNGNSTIGNSDYGIMNGNSTIGNSGYGIMNGNSTIGNSDYGIMNGNSTIGNSDYGIMNGNSTIGNSDYGIMNGNSTIGNSGYGIMNGNSTIGNSDYGIMNGNSTIGNSGYGILNGISSVGASK